MEKEIDIEILKERIEYIEKTMFHLDMIDKWTSKEESLYNKYNKELKQLKELIIQFIIKD